jgi:predicted HTH domain antitoxin
MHKKWLVGSRSSELFTPPVFLTDFIEFSGIRPEEDLSSLLEKYQEKGLSLRQITALSVHSRDRITERLKEAGVKLRPHNPARKRAFSEAQINELMHHMRKKGKTYREIAEELSRIKAKSKTGQTKWHPMMVKRMLSLKTEGF